MSSVRTLLRPNLLSFRTHFLRTSTSSQRGKVIAITTLSLFMMISLYLGARWGLARLTEIPLLVYVPPSLPLSLMLMMLIIMASITALASALSTFYLSEDLEIILASPTPSLSFFAARLLYVLCTIAWMPFVFISPVLIAMAVTYQLNIWFLPIAIIAFIPYFLISSSLGVVLATVTMAAINHRSAKFVTRFGIIAAIGITLYVINSLMAALAAPSAEGQILKMVSTISLAQSPWLPSNWIATIISELLVPTGKGTGLHWSLLLSTSIAVTGLAHIITHLLHARGYSHALARRAQARSASVEETDRKRDSLPPSAAIITKEFRTLTRDLAHNTQLVFLAGLGLLYLSNLKTFITVDTFAQNANINWQSVFFIIHSAITAFFTSAICTRLVFSSLSLEGKNYWILQTAPITFRDIIRAKFIGWFVPVCIVSTVLFATGTQILIGQWEITVIYALLNIYITYALVGLGIGLGACFADFSWEHPSQLALSLGNLIFMLLGSLMVLVNMVLLALLHRALRLPEHSVYQIALICAVTFCIAIINVGVAKSALRLGERATAAG